MQETFLGEFRWFLRSYRTTLIATPASPILKARPLDTGTSCVISASPLLYLFTIASEQEDTLGELVKKHGGGLAVLGSLIGKGGSKFNGLDIKRVYFGFVWVLYLPNYFADSLVGTGFETTVRSGHYIITQWTLTH